MSILRDRLSPRGKTAAGPATQVRVEGNVSGQLAVGENILQVHAEHGAVVNVAMPEARPVPRLRTQPPRLLPRDFRELLGREAEVGRALDGLTQGGPVELSGPAGSGKTSLLRHVANRWGGAGAAAAVHHAVAGEPLEDVLQILFESFYETDRPLKPTAAELRALLAGVRALVSLDDSELERDALGELLDFMPAATVFVTGAAQRLWGEGTSIALGGLGEAAALALFERALGRALSEAEREPALGVCRAVGGQPLRVLQAAALVEGGRADPGALARASYPQAAIERAVIEGLDEAERPVASLLAAAGGAAVHTSDVAAITGVRDAARVLDRLERRGVAVSHSPSYSLTLDAAAALEPEGWLGAAVEHFAARARAARRRPQDALSDAVLTVRLMETATSAGRFGDVIRLARALDPALAIGARWGLWDRALRMALQAARASREEAAEAWALHQTGSRALCLGDGGIARASLTQALELRERLGDHEGAEFTRHNLSMLGAAAPPPPPPPPAPRWLWIAGLGALVAVGVVVAVSTGGGKSGATPVADLSAPGSVEFGSVVTGRSRTRSVTLTNAGSAALTVPRLSIRGSTDFSLARDGCSGEPLAGGEPCRVLVRFAPAAVGEGRGSLVTAGGASTTLSPVALHGQGVPGRPPAVGRVALDPATLEFSAPERSSSEPRSVSVKNSGKRPLTLRAVRLEDGRAFTIAADTSTCNPGPLAVDASCKVDIVFTPPAGAKPGNPLEDALVVASDAPAPARATLRGTVTELTVITLVPQKLSFVADPGGTSGTQGLTVRNVGDVPLRVTGVRASGSDAGVFTVNAAACTAHEIAPQSSCELALGFTAPAGATPGQAFASGLVIEGNARRHIEPRLDGSVTNPPIP